MPSLDFSAITPIPTSLTLSAPTNGLNAAGQTAQLTVKANYQDGSTQDLTGDPCTTYLSSNRTHVTVSDTGLLTIQKMPNSSTPVTITALNDGVVGTFTFQLKPNNGPTLFSESFESGIPNGWTLSPDSIGGTSGAVPNIAPTDGNSFAYLDDSGSTSTSIYGGTVGAILESPPLMLSEGSTLSLDLDFLTNDGGGFVDFAFVQLLDSASQSVVATLYNANTSGQLAQAVPAQGPPAPPISPGVALTPAGSFFDGILTGPLGSQSYGPNKFAGGPGGSTGWVTASTKVHAGVYQLLIVVSCFGDTTVKSGLAIDNVVATP